jgi:predicted nucleotidyltransferase
MTETYQSIKEIVLAALERELPYLRENYGIDTIGIFGSVSREEDTPDSDVDILYNFMEGRGNLHEYLGFIQHLEILFGRKIDPVPLEFLDPYLKPYVKKDAVLYGSQKVIA